MGLPVSGNAQALEFPGLDIDPLLGELTGSLRKSTMGTVSLSSLLAILLLDLPLDRKAVTVPAGT